MSWNLIQTVALTVGKDEPFAPFSADALKYAGQMTLIGMGMIFSVLAVLWAVLAIFKLVFAGKTKKPPVAKPKKTEEIKESSAAEPSNDVISAVLAAGIQAYREDTDRELVAVITAAVAAYRAQEGSTGEFRVVSFKRASGGRAWNAKR